MLISQWLAQRQCPSKNSSCSSAHSLINKHLTPERLKILGLGKHRPSNGGWGAQTAQTSREDPRKSLKAACHIHLSGGGRRPLSGQRSPSIQGTALVGFSAFPCSRTPAILEEGKAQRQEKREAEPPEPGHLLTPLSWE